MIERATPYQRIETARISEHARVSPAPLLLSKGDNLSNPEPGSETS